VVTKSTKLSIGYKYGLKVALEGVDMMKTPLSLPSGGTGQLRLLELLKGVFKVEVAYG
jgi:hypothetical protein